MARRRTTTYVDETPPTERQPKLSKGVQTALYREIADKTRAAYKKSAYKARMSPYRKKLRTASRQIIEDALRTANGNISKAARNLGVNRDTIYDAVSRED